LLQLRIGFGILKKKKKIQKFGDNKTQKQSHFSDWKSICPKKKPWSGAAKFW
jgi:hypothetical protein